MSEGDHRSHAVQATPCPHWQPITIAAVEAIPLGARLTTPFRFANVVRTASENVIVRLTSTAGICGYGEACPVPQLTSERGRSIAQLIDLEVAPFLRDAEASERLHLLDRVAKSLPNAPFTRAAIDVALLDLVGRTTGLPMHVLIGGRYRDKIEVHGSVGWSGDTAEMVASARAQAELFRVLKLYAGPGSIDEDVKRIEAVREAVGPGHPFLVDVNGLWTPREACSVGARLKDCGVALLEQPVSPLDASGQRRVAATYEADFGIDVAADECVRSPSDVAMVAAEQGATVVNLGMSKLGGPSAASAAAAVAQAHRLQIMIGSVIELGVATAAGLHLAASIPTLAYPSYLMGPLKYHQQVTWPTVEILNGTIDVPMGPGLGIEVDNEALTALDLRRA